jgi:hypothetical protein
MSDTGHETEAVRVYRRVLEEVAAHEVVAEAEDVVTDAWIEEIERARHGVIECTEPVRRADRAPRERLLRARERGDRDAVARAQARLSEVVDEQNANLDRIRLVLEGLDEALERTCRAATERARQGREDLSRLRAARADAYGD